MSRRAREAATDGSTDPQSSFEECNNINNNNNNNMNHHLLDNERPKSRKQLRAERKAAQKTVKPLSKEEEKLEKRRLQKEQRKEVRKAQERLLFKELRKEKKIRKQKKIHRERNAPGGGSTNKNVTQKQSEIKNKKSNTKKTAAAAAAAVDADEQDMAMGVLERVFKGSHNDQDGMTTLRLGVKYKDIVVGTGPVVRDRTLVTVQYQLTGGKFGATLDSSKNFKFRLGKGEVIQGWDIGMAGMREGGRRKLVIPPKAGYGAQDIGAGAGATLFFDITLLSCRA